jgi:hypothetical protein
MTLTIDIPRSAEAQLEAESEREGIPVPEIVTKLVMEHLGLEASITSRSAPRPGFAADLFEGVDINALLATPIPGIEEYMPQ